MESENDDAQTGLVGSLAAGLPTCVNLRSLEVISVKQGQLAQVLASLSSPLELLETGVHRYSAQELVRLLELPALAKLKRWRVPRFRMMTLEGWEGACESRGVEARGENRFFTGESASALSLRSDSY